MSRPALAAALLLVVLPLAACDGQDDWDPSAQFAPSLRPASGLRVDGDELTLWTGTPCRGVTRLDLAFDAGTKDSTWLRFEAPDPGVDIETVTPLSGIDGMTVTEALPDGFDWRSADDVELILDGADSQWGTTTDLATVVAESADHPADTFYFDHVGWLDADDVAGRNGTEFLTPCTPDPAKE